MGGHGNPFRVPISEHFRGAMVLAQHVGACIRHARPRVHPCTIAAPRGTLDPGSSDERQHLMKRKISVSGLMAQVRRHAKLFVLGGALCGLAWTADCSVDNKVSVLADGSAGSGASEAGPSRPEAAIQSIPEPSFTDGGLVCPTTCSVGATQYCGDINNCGQTLHCG